MVVVASQLLHVYSECSDQAGHTGYLLVFSCNSLSHEIVLQVYLGVMSSSTRSRQSHLYSSVIYAHRATLTKEFCHISSVELTDWLSLYV